MMTEGKQLFYFAIEHRKDGKCTYTGKKPDNLKNKCRKPSNGKFRDHPVCSFHRKRLEKRKSRKVADIPIRTLRITQDWIELRPQPETNQQEIYKTPRDEKIFDLLNSRFQQYHTQMTPVLTKFHTAYLESDTKTRIIANELLISLLQAYSQKMLQLTAFAIPQIWTNSEVSSLFEILNNLYLHKFYANYPAFLVAKADGTFLYDIINLENLEEKEKKTYQDFLIWHSLTSALVIIKYCYEKFHTSKFPLSTILQEQLKLIDENV